ncbi:MAG: hypothetical protein ACREON_10560 [Gemmatimonadaceae bacterium]
MADPERLHFHARADANEELIARVASLLAREWDPAREFRAPDGSGDPAAHARTLLAILAGGGGAAQVVGYLRRAEEEILGVARSTGAARWSLADQIWHWSWNREPPHRS